MFDCIRNFVRYDIGNPKEFYVFNNIILAPANKEHPEVPMNTKLIEDMMFSGLYPFWCIGHLFYLEIFPMAFNVNGLLLIPGDSRPPIPVILGHPC